MNKQLLYGDSVDMLPQHGTFKRATRQSADGAMQRDLI